MLRIITLALLVCATPYIGISQYYNDMRYEAILPSYEYKKLNAQALLWLDKQDTIALRFDILRMIIFAPKNHVHRFG